MKLGFTREEIYLMPAGEAIDYINITIQEKREEAEAMKSSEKSNSNNINMAGTTL